MSFNEGRANLKVIILGGASAIGEAAARIWAEQGAHLLLVGRDASRLEAVAADLRLRGGTIETVAADLSETGAARDLSGMVERLGGVDVILLAYGVLGDHQKAEVEPEEAQKILATDFTSAAAWCLEAARILENRAHGRLIVIGSVAGDRGRASNYIYGAAKGGLGVLIQGIAHRLAKTGASATLIKPGFVVTPMTAHISRKGPFWAQPSAIAQIIVQVAARRSPPPIVYAPVFWRLIMACIRALPSPLFHKTSL
jgi:decaprenylphospho-beta-D-erythro-pentofuranosid-2-ulose 2-reductase